MITVVRDGPDRWTALRGGEVVGRLRALVRPDGRCRLLLDEVAGDVHGSLVDVALSVLDGEVHVEVDEGAVDVRAVLAERGFAVDRREHHYLVPTDLSTVLRRSARPEGFGIISAKHADVDRWRELDDALRQDVPGVAGGRQRGTGAAVVTAHIGVSATVPGRATSRRCAVRVPPRSRPGSTRR